MRAIDEHGTEEGTVKKKEATKAGRTWRIVLFNSNHQQWGPGDWWVCEARLYFDVDELVVPGYWPPTPPTTPHRPEKGTAAVTGVLAFHSNYIDPFPPLPPSGPTERDAETNTQIEEIDSAL